MLPMTILHSPFVRQAFYVLRVLGVIRSAGFAVDWVGDNVPIGRNVNATTLAHDLTQVVGSDVFRWALVGRNLVFVPFVLDAMFDTAEAVEAPTSSAPSIGLDHNDLFSSMASTCLELIARRSGSPNERDVASAPVARHDRAERVPA